MSSASLVCLRIVISLCLLCSISQANSTTNDTDNKVQDAGVYNTTELIELTTLLPNSTSAEALRRLQSDEGDERRFRSSRNRYRRSFKRDDEESEEEDDDEESSRRHYRRQRKDSADERPRYRTPRGGRSRKTENSRNDGDAWKITEKNKRNRGFEDSDMEKLSKKRSVDEEAEETDIMLDEAEQRELRKRENYEKEYYTENNSDEDEILEESVDSIYDDEEILSRKDQGQNLEELLNELSENGKDFQEEEFPSDSSLYKTTEVPEEKGDYYDRPTRSHRNKDSYWSSERRPSKRSYRSNESRRRSQWSTKKERQKEAIDARDDENKSERKRAGTKIKKRSAESGERKDSSEEKRYGRNYRNDEKRGEERVKRSDKNRTRKYNQTWREQWTRPRQSSKKSGKESSSGVERRKKGKAVSDRKTRKDESSGRKRKFSSKDSGSGDERKDSGSGDKRKDTGTSKRKKRFDEKESSEKRSSDKISSPKKKNKEWKKDSGDRKKKNEGEKSSPAKKWWPWFCIGRGGQCKSDKDCCKNKGLSCMLGKCCTAHNKRCRKDRDCCNGLACKSNTCTVVCSKLGEDCSTWGCCKDKSAICTVSLKVSKKICCKEGSQPCSADKDCCQGHCSYKEDKYGAALVTQSKICSEDETCSIQKKKTTKDHCDIDSDCCNSEKGHHSCKNNRCCRPLKAKCEDDQSCCSGICKNQRCAKKPCIRIGQSCSAHPEQSLCCPIRVAYSDEKRKVPVSCMKKGSGLDHAHLCCVADGNYCSNSKQCCPDRKCISQLNANGETDESQPKVCGIPKPPPCKPLGRYCTSTSSCCKVPGVNSSATDVQLRCESSVDNTWDIINEKNPLDGLAVNPRKPVSAPKCCIPKRESCTEHEECCGSSKCGYLHKRNVLGYRNSNKVCFNGKVNTCLEVGSKCSKPKECCMAEIPISNSVHFVPLTCAGSRQKGKDSKKGDPEKFCCIKKGHLCDDSSSCCGNLECSHPTNLNGEKLVSEPKICRKPFKEPCKDIGGKCKSHENCCEVSIKSKSSLSKTKPRCEIDYHPLVTVFDDKKGGPELQKKCCLGENELCSEHSQCCGNAKCAQVSKNGSDKCWTMAKRCITRKQPVCKPLQQNCRTRADCCIIPVLDDDDFFFVHPKCQWPVYTLLEARNVSNSLLANKDSVENKEMLANSWWTGSRCCLERGSPCSSDLQCCTGFSCQRLSGRKMCAPPPCSGIGQGCQHTQKCCQLREDISIAPVCAFPFRNFKVPPLYPTQEEEKSPKADEEATSLPGAKGTAIVPRPLPPLQDSFAPLPFCCIPEGQICLRNSDCCDQEATCGHKLQETAELWMPGEKPRRCYVFRCRKCAEACDFDSECCEEDTICSRGTSLSLVENIKKCCKVKGSFCNDSKDCCLGKCFHEENAFGVILGDAKRCIDGSCQELGKATTGASCEDGPDCCGFEQGSQDCYKGSCCRIVEQACDTSKDCCTEFCENGKCAEKHCLFAGQPCQPDSTSEQCCETSVKIPNDETKMLPTCGAAHASMVWDGNHLIKLPQKTACCFAEGEYCNDDSQCCSGTHCVFENDQFGTKKTEYGKRCLKNTCLSKGKLATGKYCRTTDECCGCATGDQICSEGVCCRPNTQDCEEDSQCCGRAICYIGEDGKGTCRTPPCVTLGSICDKDSTCCTVPNHGKEMTPQCQRGYENENSCCLPEGFDCSYDSDCCAGSRCVIPTDQYGFQIFDGSERGQKKCLTDKCALGYAKPPGNECLNYEDCCGSDAGIQDCLGGLCCIKDDWECESSLHCCNGYCDPDKKVCLDPSCRALGENCIATLEQSCCKTLIHESPDDDMRESVVVFPDNTEEIYRNTDHDSSPRTSVVKEKHPDDGWSTYHTPVAIEVMPVCRVSPTTPAAHPKCCIDYGLRCEKREDCCQYLEDDEIDCVYQEDAFGVEVHVWGKFCLKSSDRCPKEGTNGLCTTDDDCCGSAVFGKNGDVLQRCRSDHCCKTNSNKCVHNSECCSGYCDPENSVCREPPCVTIGEDCTAYNTNPEICCKMDVFAPEDPYHPVDWVMPTCYSSGSTSRHNCCMEEGQLCNQESDCCAWDQTNPAGVSLKHAELVCVLPKDIFGVSLHGSAKKCTRKDEWCDQKATGDTCVSDSECCGYDKDGGQQRCMSGHCCRENEQSCNYGTECCTGYCHPDGHRCEEEPCNADGDLCETTSDCCGSAECHFPRDSFGFILPEQHKVCTKNKCAVLGLSPPSGQCLEDEDCCQRKSDGGVQECSENKTCCIVDKQECAYDKQCCSQYCDPGKQTCSQPPCRSLGGDCTQFPSNPQICCPMKLTKDNNWKKIKPGKGGQKKQLIQPSCQQLESGGLGCCLSLYTPCLHHSDCCQLKNQPVSCMVETNDFGQATDGQDYTKRCLIADESCDLVGTGDPCTRNEDCCGYSNEDGILQVCKKRNGFGQSVCCKVKEQECASDNECCTNHCDLWTGTCAIPTCTKLGDECSSEPNCCPVSKNNGKGIVKPACTVVGLTSKYVETMDIAANDGLSTYWKQCCLQKGDPCMKDADCCGGSQGIAQCSAQTLRCVEKGY